MAPLISVIIPVYNTASTLPTALKSMLNQTYQNLEIIIINDNSKDNPKEKIKKYLKRKNVFFYHLPYKDNKRFNIYKININAGWMARNYGIKKAKGDWITFQDADDASLKNRIEIQYYLAKKYSAFHVCIDWMQYKKSLENKKLNIKAFLKTNDNFIIKSAKILNLAKKCKGIGFNILGKWHHFIPFIIKKRKVFSFLFFKKWLPYPGAGSCPLVKKEVFKKVLFRPLDKRIWPSIKGRGADRDFNFQTAETFNKSITVKLPLYLWRQKHKNPIYKESKYFLKVL